MNEYTSDHLIAKLIVGIIVSALITTAQLLELPWSIFLNTAAVFVWLFSIDTMGYVVEIIRHHKHKHPKV